MSHDEKTKRQHTLPDRQLARAFRFSADDLASNRHGFITQAQSWAIPLWLRGAWHRVQMWARMIPKRTTQRAQVAMVCGRASLHYEQHHIQSIFHADMIEVHKLAIAHLEFRLTVAQYQAIGEGVIYRLYYNPDNQQILSLERALNGC